MFVLHKDVNLCHIGNFLMFVPATGRRHRYRAWKRHKL